MNFLSEKSGYASKFVHILAVKAWTNLLTTFPNIFFPLGHMVFLTAYLIKHNITDDIFAEPLNGISMLIIFSQL